MCRFGSYYDMLSKGDRLIYTLRGNPDHSLLQLECLLKIIWALPSFMPGMLEAGRAIWTEPSSSFLPLGVLSDFLVLPFHLPHTWG